MYDRVPTKAWKGKFVVEFAKGTGLLELLKIRCIVYSHLKHNA